MYKFDQVFVNKEKNGANLLLFEKNKDSLLCFACDYKLCSLKNHKKTVSNYSVSSWLCAPVKYGSEQDSKKQTFLIKLLLSRFLLQFFLDQLNSSILLYFWSFVFVKLTPH